MFESIPVIEKIGGPDRGVGGTHISIHSGCLAVQLQILKVALAMKYVV